MTTFILREVARQFDISASDALDVCRECGVKQFWHDGEQFDLDQLDRYLRRDHRYDPVPELEFDSTPALDNRLRLFELEQAIADLQAEASHEDFIAKDSPNLRRLFALQGAAA